ncbi:MAG TPA: DUF5668 domain-containing protein [Candidatus Limnocylindria bacterium]|nr:DUF5668 domain-containing protein [Candidatus Limnocylindria bacterium]
MTARRRGVFWPVLLIAIGLVFLLQNFGVISGVSWLALARLWPLLLILIGLDIAFAPRWPLPTLATEVLVIAAGLALVAYAPGVGGFIFFSHDGGTGVTDASVPRGSATALSLRINGGAANSYRVTGGATAIVEAHSANADLRVRTSGTSRVQVTIDQVGPENIAVFRTVPPAEIEVRIASDVPTSFDMNAAAGEFDVDLSDVRVTDARVNTGASAMRLVLPKPTGEVALRINGGASNIVVTVPDAVEAKLTTTGGLLSLRSDNPRLGTGGGAGGCVACGNAVETSGYASARDRVTVTISAGASSIVVH